MYKWLNILGCRRISGRTKREDDVIYITEGDWDALSMAFYCDFELADAGHTYRVAVDAFPLLYELIAALERLNSRNEIEIVLGEGWMITCVPTTDGFDIRAEWENVNLQHRLSRSELALFPAVKAAEVIASLDAIDVDVEGYIAMFPPGTYRRNTS